MFSDNDDKKPAKNLAEFQERFTNHFADFLPKSSYFSNSPTLTLNKKANIQEALYSLLMAIKENPNSSQLREKPPAIQFESVKRTVKTDFEKILNGVEEDSKIAQLIREFVKNENITLDTTPRSNFNLK